MCDKYLDATRRAPYTCCSSILLGILYTHSDTFNCTTTQQPLFRPNVLRISRRDGCHPSQFVHEHRCRHERSVAECGEEDCAARPQLILGRNTVHRPDAGGEQCVQLVGCGEPRSILLDAHRQSLTPKSRRGRSPSLVVLAQRKVARAACLALSRFRVDQETRAISLEIIGKLSQ